VRGNSPFRAGIGVALACACSAVLLVAVGVVPAAMGASSSALAARASTAPRATPSRAPEQTAEASSQPTAGESSGAESLSPQSSAIAAALTAEIAVVDLGDASAGITAEIFDPSQGSFQFAGPVTITPDGFASQAVAPATYRLTFVFITTADLTATSPKPSLIATLGTCVLEVADGDHYQFAISSDGVVVARNGEAPAPGTSMTIDESPLCHALVPTPAPS
jgi:hypothetical protein